MKTAKGKDNGCGTRRWAGNFRPAPTVGVGGESDPIKTSLAFEYDYAYMVDEIIRQIKIACEQE
ncbi:MAG: hypothetical protein ACFNYD_08355, partial [Bacteroides sp.]